MPLGNSAFALTDCTLVETVSDVSTSANVNVPEAVSPVLVSLRLDAALSLDLTVKVGAVLELSFDELISILPKATSEIAPLESETV